MLDVPIALLSNQVNNYLLHNIINFDEGRTSPQKSVITGITNPKCGMPCTFTIEARDIFGNLQDLNDIFLVELVGPETIKASVVNKGNFINYIRVGRISGTFYFLMVKGNEINQFINRSWILFSLI